MFNPEINRALIAAADLVNTAEGIKSARHTTDTLNSIEGLKSYLDSRDAELGWPVSQAKRAQVDKVRTLREKLGQVWTSAPVTDHATVEIINELLDGVGTRLIPENPKNPAGTYLEVPIPVSGQVADTMTATIAAALRHLTVEEETGRLRICKGDECGAAIVDLTRNRSKLFCDFGNCANRAHVRAYRARQAAMRNGTTAEADDAGGPASTARKLTKPSAAEKADSINRPTSASAVAAKEFRDRMREELMEKRQKSGKKAKKSKKAKKG